MVVELLKTFDFSFHKRVVDDSPSTIAVNCALQYNKGHVDLDVLARIQV